MIDPAVTHSPTGRRGLQRTARASERARIRFEPQLPSEGLLPDGCAQSAPDATRPERSKPSVAPRDLVSKRREMAARTRSTNRKKPSCLGKARAWDSRAARSSGMTHPAPGGDRSQNESSDLRLISMLSARHSGSGCGQASLFRWRALRKRELPIGCGGRGHPRNQRLPRAIRADVRPGLPQGR